MPPDVFCGMGKLTKIVLCKVLVPKYVLPSLFSNCHQLEEGCTFEFSIHIIGPTLRRLSIIDFDNVPWNLDDIDALNITSLDYRGQMRICCIWLLRGRIYLFWIVCESLKLYCSQPFVGLNICLL